MCFLEYNGVYVDQVLLTGVRFSPNIGQGRPEQESWVKTSLLKLLPLSLCARHT